MMNRMCTNCPYESLTNKGEVFFFAFFFFFFYSIIKNRVTRDLIFFNRLILMHIRFDRVWLQAVGRLLASFESILLHSLRLICPTYRFYSNRQDFYKVLAIQQLMTKKLMTIYCSPRSVFLYTQIVCESVSSTHTHRAFLCLYFWRISFAKIISFFIFHFRSLSSDSLLPLIGQITTNSIDLLHIFCCCQFDRLLLFMHSFIS